MKAILRTGFLALAIMALAVPANAGPFEDGWDAYQRSDYATALEFWRPLADQGDAEAQFNLGVMYESGQGVPQDDAEAVKWFQKAAEKGSDRARLRGECRSTAKAECLERTILLDGDWTAHIATDESALTLTVTLWARGASYSDGHYIDDKRTTIAELVKIDHASFNVWSAENARYYPDIRPIKLCRGTEPAYFIGAWDRSSTYGHTTGFVLWKFNFGGGWNISKLPLGRADIEVPDAEGVSTIIDTYPLVHNKSIKRFHFCDGNLIELAGADQPLSRPR